MSLLDYDFHIREKLKVVLDIPDLQYVDVNNETLEKVQRYWMEDVKLIEELTKAEQKHFISQFDHSGTCVDIYSNPGVTIQKDYLCDVPGLCEVCTTFLYYLFICITIYLFLLYTNCS